MAEERYASVTRDGELLFVRDTTVFLRDRYERKLTLVRNQAQGVLGIVNPEGRLEISLPYVSLKECIVVAKGEQERLDIFFVSPEQKKELTDWLGP